MIKTKRTIAMFVVAIMILNLFVPLISLAEGPSTLVGFDDGVINNNVVTYTVGNTTVDVTINNGYTLENDALDIENENFYETLSDAITIGNNFNSETMMIKIYADDGFWTELTLQNDGSLIREQQGGLPGEIHFAIVERNSGQGGGDNPPAEGSIDDMKDLMYTVDFGLATWNVNGQDVTATVDGKTINNGQVEIEGDEVISLYGFDPNNMQVTIRVVENGVGPEGWFSSRLDVNEEEKTCIMNIQTRRFLPNDKPLEILVESRKSDAPENNLPDANTSANVTIRSNNAHRGSYYSLDTRIGINGFPIEFINPENYNPNAAAPESITINGVPYAYNEVNGNGKVFINIGAIFTRKYVGTITVNEQEFNVADYINYANRTDWLNHYSGQCVGFNIEVNKAANYDIVVDLEDMERDYQYIGNFLWTDDPNESQSDLYIGNSRLEVVSVEYEFDGAKIFVEEQDLQNDPHIEYDPYGRDGHTRSLVVPEGAMCTMRITPRYGYQVTSFGVNGNAIITGDAISEFTFPIHRGNFHLGAEVTPVNDAVDAVSEKVISGSVEIGQNEIDSGTVVLTVDDFNPTQEKMDEFEERAKEEGDYRVDSYLDISLDQVWYRGAQENPWTIGIPDLQDDATIELELTDDMKDKEIIVIHNIHNRENYEVIDAEYNDETNTITFNAKSFSNYAIATKDNPTDPGEDPGEDPGQDPGQDPGEDLGQDPGEDPATGEKEYTVKAGNFTVIFTDDEGHDFELLVINLSNLSSEELAEMGLSEEEYEQAKNEVIEQLKEYGTVLGLYEIEVFDPDVQYAHFGSVKIKIRITGEMEKYNSFKLICVDDDPIPEEDIIPLKEEDGYLVGDLKHLSAYALVAKNVETAKAEDTNAKTDNPVTGDNIMFHVTMFIIAIVVMGITTKTKK